MTCTNSHSKDFLDTVVPRTNAVELIGGRDGYGAMNASVSPMPVLLRIKLWWWKKRRGGGG